jgi:peptidyl-prolyl cis-trans isomerase C
MLSIYALKIAIYNKLYLFAILVFSFFLIFNNELLSDENKSNKIVAQINGSNLYLSDINNARKMLNSQAQKYPLKIVYDFLLDDLINSRLIIEAARKMGIDKEEEIKRQINNSQKNILYRAFMDRAINREVSKDQLKLKYNEYIKSNSGIEEIRARHILVQTREQALEAIELLIKGAGFSDLAKKISTGPTKIVGGDLGYFDRGSMVSPFSKAAFLVKIGEFTSSPIKTQFGWHIIKVEDKRVRKTKAFENIKAKIIKEIIIQREEAFLAKLRKSAEIQKYPMIQ